MRRCYQNAAFAAGLFLVASTAFLDSCGMGPMTVYAAEDGLTEEMATAFQEEVQTRVENVETDVQAEEIPAIEAVPEEEAIPAVEAVPEEEAIPAAEAAPEEEVVSAAVTAPVEEVIVAGNPAVAGQEYETLLRIVEAEAGCEDMTGKLLVANVIMNRVRSASFPNTVTEVVYQRHNGTAQFSPTANGRINTVVVSADTVEAVNRALSGEDISAGALYFRAVQSNCGWFDRALSRVVEHGNHIFYAM